MSELFGNANWPDNITYVFTNDYESTLIILKDCDVIKPCTIDSQSVPYFKWPRDMSRYELRDGLYKHLVVSSGYTGSFDQIIKTSVAKLFVEAAVRFGGGNGYYSFALFERHFDNFYIHTYTALQKFGITLVCWATRRNSCTQMTIFSKMPHIMF